MSHNEEDVAAVFEDLGDLEKEFATVELDALRRKEFHLRNLYTKRAALTSKIPDFWPTAFGNGPEELQQFFSPDDLPLIAALSNFTVERFHIKSETQGEPRSLRFTFEFADNPIIDDKKVVKEFEFRPSEEGAGSLVSRAVPVKFKSKKTDLTHGLLDAAVELQAAEEALKLKNGETEIDVVDREALWQHEKLREKLVKLDEDDDKEPSFFNWLGFRGAVNTGFKKAKAKSEANGNANGDAEENIEDDEADDADEMLEVEIFPAGEEIAIALAEELWPDAMDYFMGAQEEAPFAPFDGFEDEEDEEEDDDDEEAPELVDAPEEEGRPKKRPRTG